MEVGLLRFASLIYKLRNVENDKNTSRIVLQEASVTVGSLTIGVF